MASIMLDFDAAAFHEKYTPLLLRNYVIVDEHGEPMKKDGEDWMIIDIQIVRRNKK